jgi:ribosomal protein L11 methyltransferase
MSQEAPSIAVRIDLPTTDAELIFDCLPLPEAIGSAWIEDTDKSGHIHVFVEDHRQAREHAKILTDFLASVCPDDQHSVRICEIHHENWAESWKAHFHAERVSPRIVIRPSWESVETGPGDVLVTLDPGMIFGTGQHETTRACLQLIDRIRKEGPPQRLLDLGCGSGILSIAAAGLGYADVTGIDNFPDAVRASESNASVNGVRCSFATMDVLELELPSRYDVVVANILSSVLIRAARRVAATADTLGTLILSGILNEQFEMVSAAYESQGFAQADCVQLGDWSTGLFRRRVG